MEGWRKNIGFKIKSLSGSLAGDFDIVENRSKYSQLYDQLDNPAFVKKYFFYLLGEYTLTGSEEIKKDLLTFANLLGQKSVNSAGFLDLSIGLVYESRTTVITLLKDEALAGRLSNRELFMLVEMLDPLHHAILTAVISHYNDTLSATKYALDESEEDLRITLNELAELKRALNEATIFSVMDENDRYMYVNERFCEVTKFSRDELIGQTPAIIDAGYHPREYFYDIWVELSKGNSWRGEILCRAKDGSTFWADSTIVPFLDKNGNKYKHMTIQYDITEKKQTEESLQKAEKLSMVGELAAGFAHEIRNPLTTIKGFVQLLTEATQETIFAKTILDEIDRINSIVSEFMIFARPHTIDYSLCDLSEILGGAVRFLEPEALLRNVIFVTHFPEGGVMINGEKNQLKQVFLNILKNAIEAIPDGGIVSVKVEAGDKDATVTIGDTGIGMTDEQLKKLGEPFFTTKSYGNGLGLMVSYKIIQEHKGRISVESKGTSRGTTFTISFPYNHKS